MPGKIPCDLHILNGDHAFDLWQQCDFSGETLVWKEVYLEGPLPDTDDLELFRKARADFLIRFAELADLSYEQLYLYLQKMEITLLAFPDTGRLMLWFDACIFDQTLLMRILYLISLRKNPVSRIALYCGNCSCLDLDDFKNSSEHIVLLDHHDVQTAAEAWHLFQQQDAQGMIRLAEQGDFTHLPQMKKALIRCADEVPDGSGLTRTQRQILQVIADGAHSFIEIFIRLDQFEEYPFLGDTSCQRHLNHLIAKGLLICKNDLYFPA